MRVITCFLFIILATSASAYYADVEIVVEENGLVSIKGNTNHPVLDQDRSPDFTSKKGKYWLLNITTDDTFSSMIYKLSLPDNSEVNYLRAPALSRISDNNGIIIIGAGENKTFNLLVQYRIERPGADNFLDWTIMAIIAGILVIAGVIIFIKKRSKEDYALTKRQEKIVRALRTHKRLTQKELEKMLNIPKSSLSRNIESLQRREIIHKEQTGMSNVLTLVPQRSGKFRQK
ncbi:MAG: helix-turn-helix transcriptional regulator [Candidatus Woesearchaeota archaeon]